MKAFKTVLIIVAVIILLPFFGLLGWFLKKEQPMEVVVINKSMLEFQGSENKAINWVLNDQKVFTNGNRKYNMKVDYYGYHKMKDDYRIRYPRLKELDRMTEKSDFVYFADVAGISEPQRNANPKSSSKSLEYGGLNNTDYVFCRKLIESGKPLVVECNFFGPPTEPLVRYNMEQLTDVYYAGWMGKYVKDLSKPLSGKEETDWKKVYESYAGKPWDFTGKGLIFINLENTRVVVLREGEDIRTKKGFIVTLEEGLEEFDLPETANYTGWFTLVHPGKNKVIANFSLNPTETGVQKLQQNGLPHDFPAIIQPGEQFYFLAGDFGKSKVNLVFSRTLFFNNLVSILQGGGSNASNFFYSYYQPFMDHVLSESRGQVEDTE